MSAETQTQNPDPSDLDTSFPSPAQLMILELGLTLSNPSLLYLPCLPKESKQKAEGSFSILLDMVQGTALADGMLTGFCRERSGSPRRRLLFWGHDWLSLADLSALLSGGQF